MTILRKIAFVLMIGMFSVASFAAELININTADAKTLTELKGIGKNKAQAIINYREKNGPFPSLAALVKVRGVGKLILNTNRNKMTVN